MQCEFSRGGYSITKRISKLLTLFNHCIYPSLSWSMKWDTCRNTQHKANLRNWGIISGGKMSSTVSVVFERLGLSINN